MKGFHKMAVKDSVKVGYKMSGVGRVTKIGKSEGGWILGENGFYTADPKWVGDQDASSTTIERVQQGRSVTMCGSEAKVALGSTKVRKPKKKLPAMATVGSGNVSKVGSIQVILQFLAVPGHPMLDNLVKVGHALRVPLAFHGPALVYLKR